MKMFASTMFAIVALSLGAQAQADWGRPGPGWGRPGPGHGPGWGSCTVLFEKCDFALNGICVRWNHKAEEVSRRDADWACNRLEHQYGRLKSCYIQNCR